MKATSCVSRSNKENRKWRRERTCDDGVEAIKKQLTTNTMNQEETRFRIQKKRRESERKDQIVIPLFLYKIPVCLFLFFAQATHKECKKTGWQPLSLLSHSQSRRTHGERIFVIQWTQREWVNQNKIRSSCLSVSQTLFSSFDDQLVKRARGGFTHTIDSHRKKGLTRMECWREVQQVDQEVEGEIDWEEDSTSSTNMSHAPQNQTRSVLLKGEEAGFFSLLTHCFSAAGGRKGRGGERHDCNAVEELEVEEARPDFYPPSILFEGSRCRSLSPSYFTTNTKETRQERERECGGGRRWRLSFCCFLLSLTL